MPQALPAIYAWLQGGSLAAGVVKAVAYAAVSAFVGQQLARKALDGLGGGSQLQMSREPAPVGRVIYGETRVSGPILFAETQDEGDQKNEHLWLVVALAAHEVAQIGPTYYRDDTPVYLQTSGLSAGYAVGDLAGYYAAYPHLGGASQTVDTVLDGLSTAWTSAHRLRGVAYVFWRLRHSTKWMSSIPNLSAVVRGKLVYDPRTSSTGWSDNPALCILDYLTDPDVGLGCSLADEIDIDSFISAANACDEVVGLAGSGVAVLGDLTSGSALVPVVSTAGLYAGMRVTGSGIPADTTIAHVEADPLQDPVIILSAPATATGSGVSLTAAATEKRYRIGLAFETSAEPGTVLQEMVACLGGELYYSGGRFILHAGVGRSATGPAITEDDLCGSIEVQTRSALRDACNRVRGTFTFPGDNYVEREFPAVTNSLYLSEDDGYELWTDLRLPGVISAGQAQRLAKIHLETSRQDTTVTMRCKVTQLGRRPGDIVPLTFARYGWSAKPFRVVTRRRVEEASGDGETAAVVIDLELREYAAAAYDWADGAETIVDPAPNTSLALPE